MQALNLQIRHINSEKDLLAWVIERLGETGPFEPVPAELDRYCDELIKALVEGDPIVFAPITDASVQRALEISADDLNVTTRRSIPLLDFLCIMGELLNDKYLYNWIFPAYAIETAIRAWDSSQDFIIFWEHGSCKVLAQSTTLCRLNYNVIINVQLEEFPMRSAIKCLDRALRN